jgi:3-oxoacyl-[acyl-carrier protein] reductase
MDTKFLKDKCALVTGAYRNLGSITAETLARNGADVVINDIDSPALKDDCEKVLENIRAHDVRAMAIEADLGSSEAVRVLCEKALDAMGRIDIVVNNAGPFNMDPYVDLDEKVWDMVMNVNLKAVYLTAKWLAPGMRKNSWGRIVNMCAGSAYVRNHNVYTLAKKGVETISESLALELGPEITVNAVAPGQIKESLPDIHEFDPTFGERYTAHAPLRRLVTRSEIANIIALICSPAFDTMTGMTIRVDGGAEIPRF